MKKTFKYLKYLIIVLAVAVAAFAFGCSADTSPKMINEIPGYENLTKTPVKISVNYDDDVYYGQFEITDEAVISEISDIIFNKIKFCVGTEPYGGGYINIKFIDADNKSYAIPIRAHTDNLPDDSYYAATDIKSGSVEKLWRICFEQGNAQGVLQEH